MFKELYAVELSVFMGLSVKELVRDADLVEVHARVPTPVKRFAGNDLFDRIPAECNAIYSARLGLFTTSPLGASRATTSTPLSFVEGVR